MKKTPLLVYQIITLTAGVIFALATAFGAILGATWAATTGFICVAIWAFVLVTAIPVMAKFDPSTMGPDDREFE